MSSVAIIPARGGSRRIPRKNIRSFLGKPIIAYSIDAALGSGLFQEVMVSTDDEEIADVARKYGASVPFMRSLANSDDHAGTMDVILEVLETYERAGRVFSYACCIYPTAPLISAADLLKGFERLTARQELACVFPVVPFSYPVWRGLEVRPGGVNMIWPEYKDTRSQDLKEVYHDAGQWYWFKLSGITGWDWPSNSECIVLPEERVQDIDNLSDWRMAELKYNLITERQ